MLVLFLLCKKISCKLKDFLKFNELLLFELDEDEMTNFFVLIFLFNIFFFLNKFKGSISLFEFEFDSNK